MEDVYFSGYGMVVMVGLIEFEVVVIVVQVNLVVMLVYVVNLNVEWQIVVVGSDVVFM